MVVSTIDDPDRRCIKVRSLTFEEAGLRLSLSFYSGWA